MKHKLKNLVHWVPALPFFILVIAFLMIPLANMVVESFLDPASGAFTFQNYATIATKPAYYIATWNSVKVALLSTAIGMVICFFAALAVTSIGFSARRWFMPILNMTQNFAGFPLAFSFMLMFGNTGFIMLAAKHLGIEFITQYKLYSSEGMIPMFIWFAIPLGTLLLIPGFETIRKEWKESATLMGANSAQFWWKVGIPNLLPSLLGTTSMMFADSITTYTTVYMIMGANATMLPIKIASMFSGDSKQKTELGSALSITMILIILLVMLITNILKKRCVKGGLQK
ncbi:ABC transporter permease [Bacillota bacterium Meth-B3]|nr:ABC transporter permease subunit [Christensenellaceae bacterium]